MKRELSDIATNILNEIKLLQGKRGEIIYILNEIEDSADDDTMTDSEFREWVRKKAKQFKKTL